MKLTDELNNNSSCPFRGYIPCIHKKRFERPSENAKVKQIVTYQNHNMYTDIHKIK